MHHTHFNTIHSTQVYLRDNLVELKKNSSEILITASEQTMGIGRKDSRWDSYSNSIAMSFIITPNYIPTMTPIEVGILTSEFLKKNYNIYVFLKWPNDLITSENKKCGGIIAQYIDTETVIAGLGLNLGDTKIEKVPEHYKQGLGYVSQKIIISIDEQKNLPVRIYQFILSNRIKSSIELQERFKKSCIHMDKLVSIDDDGNAYSGLFKGIGSNGEALVEIQGEIKPYIASSLKILTQC